jgi:hypothetical protein
MSPDLAARRVIIAAYLYYNHAAPVVSDEAFDKTCKYVANNWDRLEPIRQWQLGSPEDLLATGHHILITPAGEFAALAMHCAKVGASVSGPLISDWKVHEIYGRYSGLSG